MADKRKAYKRVLLKLSGEVFGGAKGVGVDPDVVHVCQIAVMRRAKIQTFAGFV